MTYLLDTNVFREVGKSAPRHHVGAWLDKVDDADLAVNAPTVREVRKGIERLRIRKPDMAALIAVRVESALLALGERLLTVTGDVADLWGALLAES